MDRNFIQSWEVKLPAPSLTPQPSNMNVFLRCNVLAPGFAVWLARSKNSGLQPGLRDDSLAIFVLAFFCSGVFFVLTGLFVLAFLFRRFFSDELISFGVFCSGIFLF